MGRPNHPIVAALAALTIAGLAGPSPAQSSLTLKVAGVGKVSGEVPVVVECPEDLAPGPYDLRAAGGKPGPVADVFRDAGKTYLGVILKDVPAEGTTAYTLTPSAQDGRGSRVSLRAEGRRVEVKVGGQPLTTYIPDDGPKPYFFPLVGPSGAKMTRAYPMQTVEGEKRDHPHHRSVWFTHGNIDGVDFWSEAPKHGTIRETGRPTVASGQAVGTLRTTDDWVGPDGKKVLTDERVARFYATSAGRVIDFEFTLMATEGPITFGDTKEGMFGLRVPSSMDVDARKGGRIVNAEGLVDAKAWGQPAPWVDYSGPADGKTVGIAIFNAPDSFRYPTTWHVRTYGLFAANPFGWHDFGRKESGTHDLPMGQSIRFRYRVLLHDGDATSAHVAEAARAYEAPPKVSVE